MTNAYYNASGAPVAAGRGLSAAVRSEFESIEAGFDLFTARIIAVQQVVQVVYTTQTAITSASATDTGLTASITPSVNTNKVLVLVSQNYNMERNNASQNAEIRLLRGSTPIDYAFLGNFANAVTSIQMAGRLSMAFLDSPASASSVTYKTQAYVTSATNSATITLQPSGYTSTITLLEVTV